MKLTFSTRALKEISAIFDYIANENPAAAEMVRARIYVIAQFAAEFPYTGRPVGMRGTRVLPVKRYPYLVFFRRVPGQQEVRILRVRHGARRHPGFQDEAAEFVVA